MNIELTDVEKELQKEFALDVPTTKIIFSASEKAFISFDNGIITCPLNVRKGNIIPSLFLNRNDITYKVCQDFQNLVLYFDNTGKRQGSLEYGFTDNAERIFCKITDFDGVESNTPDINRIIQFKQNDEEFEPIQWDRLIQYTKFEVNIEQHRLPSIPMVKIFWVNLNPYGFVVCSANQFEKSLIITINKSYDFSIPLKKIDIFNTIRLFWPELDLNMTVYDEKVFDFTTSIFKMFPEVKPGIIRLTKHHKESKLKCYQTHVSC